MSVEPCTGGGTFSMNKIFSKKFLLNVKKKVTGCFYLCEPMYPMCLCGEKTYHIGI